MIGFLYALARLLNTLGARSPSRRAKNVAVGRGLGRTGIWVNLNRKEQEMESIMHRREELYELAREAGGDGDLFVNGLAKLAGRDVHDAMTEQAEHGFPPDVGSPEWFEEAALIARRLAMAAEVVSDYERQETPA